MRLNLVNLPSLIGAGLSSVACGSFNPKFGNKVPVSEDLFKYVIPGPPKEVFLFERISLNDLFDGIPQSIVGLVQRDWFEPSAGELNERMALNLTVQDIPAMDMEPVEQDELAKQFLVWNQFIGLGALTLADVELSSADGWLHVDARRSVVFKGNVSIKVKEAE